MPPEAIDDAAALKERWLAVALDRAGVDPAHWEPLHGARANRAVIEAIYRYYARLFLDDERYRWAGMAAMVGPSFYAAFLDLGLVPDAIRRLAANGRALTGRVSGATVDRELAAYGLGYLELTFLTMQRKIFEDQAVLHEAHRGGGVEAIRALADAGLVDAATAGAWAAIDAGAQPGLDAGNRTLLWREQYTIIDRFYRQLLRFHAPAGLAFTYGMTLGGWPSVPGARGFGAVYPLSVPLPLRGARGPLALRTPLAAGNIARFHDRWALIDGDTLPSYLRFLRERPADLRAELERPLAERVRRWRTLRRLPGVARAALVDWRLASEAGRAPQASPPPALDLTTPAALGGDALPVASTSGAPDGSPLALRLPDGRGLELRVRQVLAYRDAGGRVEQVVVKLPSVAAGAAQALVDRVVAGLGAPPPARAAAGDLAAPEAFRTTVGAPAELGGWLRAEVQLEHHLDEGRVALDLLLAPRAPGRR
jgi:hypothetical protein